MPTIEVVNMLWLGVGGWAVLALLVYLFYGPLQENAVDKARQQLFEARDTIFLIVHQYDIDGEWHTKMRKTINAFIRYAHKMTWPRILLTIFVLHRQDRKRDALRDIANEVSNERARREIQDQVSIIMRAMIFLIMERSLLLVAIRSIVRAQRQLGYILGISRPEVTSAVSNIANDAYLEEMTTEKRLIDEACAV